MARRWVWRTGAVLLAALLVAGVWRLARDIPLRLAAATEALRDEAARVGLRISFKDLRLNPFALRVTVDDLSVDDLSSGRNLARAESVEAFLSPGRLLAGETPVSRIRIRSFLVRASDEDRPLFERIRAARGPGKGEPLPDLLFVDGRLIVGPLGPLRRVEARLSELRIESSRFLGRRITASVEEMAGEIDVPGAGPAKIPFGSLSAALSVRGGIVRLRRAEAEGAAASVRLSGVVDPEKRTGTLTATGKGDLAAWIAAGAPAGAWISPYLQEGQLEFTATARGSLEAPEGTARVALRNGRVVGEGGVAGEMAVEASAGRYRLTSLRGVLWGGALTGSGWYDRTAGRMEGKLSLAGAALGRAPWPGPAFPWRAAGRGDLQLSFAGGPGRVDAALSLRNPQGFERTAAARPGRNGGAVVRLPLSADASIEVAPDERSIRIARLELRAGGAVVTGAGTAFPWRKEFDLAGRFSIPAGKAGDYGWAYPLAWRELAGEWEAGWEGGSRRVAAGVRAQGLEMRALPPVPAAVKLEGDPGDLIHFVADLPAGVADVTATGTVTGPLAGGPVLLDASVGVRRLDLSRVGEWAGAVLVSLGADAAGARRQLAGLRGTGNADIELAVGSGRISLSGTFAAPEVRRGEVAVLDAAASGRYVRAGTADSWEAGVSGAMGEGGFRIRGEGRDGVAEISGEGRRLDLQSVASLLGVKAGRTVGGTAEVAFQARTGAAGWDLPRLSVKAGRISVGRASLAGFEAEGLLGPSSGRIAATLASPAARFEAQISRTKGWPCSFVARVDDAPAEAIALALVPGEASVAGTWSVEASGQVRAADLLAGDVPLAEVLSELRFAASGKDLEISGVAFREVRAEGAQRGGAVTGAIRTQNPDTDLAFSLGLRDPFPFELTGPFAVGRAGAVPSAGAGGGAPRKEEQRARLALEGRVRVKGAFRALEWTAGSLDVRRLQYRNGGVEVSGADISLEMSREGVRWAGGAVRAAGSPLRISGRASWTGDLDVRLEGALPAAALRTVTDVFERLDGTMRLDLRVTGRLRDPVVVGTGRVENALLSFRDYAQLFEGMSAEAVISREKILFESIKGRSGGGYIDGWGELPLRFDGSRNLFFSVDFFDMRYPYPADLRPVVQGHVDLAGPANDFLVTGDVEVQSALYSKNVKLETALIDFRRRFADVKARPGKVDFRVRFDINVVADDTIRIENNLGKGTARGEFKVVGDTRNVVVLGSFDLTEGYLQYGGNRYDIPLLTVEFQDPRRNNPRLDGRAEARIKDVNVTVLVTGTLEKPEIDVTSDQALSKNELVALLALGAAPGGEAGVAAGEAAAIALVPLGAPVEKGVTGAIGLNRFAIEPAFSSATQKFEPRFTVGKNVGDRFSVNLSTTVGTAAETSVSAEYEFYKDMFLQGAWDSGTESSRGDLGVDVKIRYRYRQFKDLWRAGD